MALGFGRRPKERPQEPAEETSVPMPEPEEAPELPEGTQLPEACGVSEPVLADEPTPAPIESEESAADEAARYWWGAPDPAEHIQTAAEAPLVPPALRANANTLSLLNSLLRLHEVEDMASLSDAADDLTRTHLNGTHLVTLLADKGGSFRLQAAKSSITGVLVKRLSEALGTDMRVEIPPPRRGRMAKIWLTESASPQSVSLADFWGSAAGEEVCQRAEKALAISEIAAVRLASSEGPLGIALFISLGDPPDPPMLVAIGNHLTVALANLRNIEKARQFGTVDPVRWIPDRQEFAHQLAREVSRARRYGHAVSLVLLAVDNFDTLRIEYGWTVTNRLLRSMSAALRERLRESDYLGSYSHNGYGIILVQTPGEAALETAVRLCEAAEGVRILEGDDCPMPKCAVATASSPEDGGDASSLLLAAESLLLPKRHLSSASA